MEKNEMKKVFKLSAFAILLVTLLALTIAVFSENNILAIAVLVTSGLGIIVIILGIETYKASTIFSTIELYGYLVSIVIAISIILDSDLLLKIAIALFVIIICGFTLPFIIDKLNKTNQQSNKKYKKNNKKR